MTFPQQSAGFPGGFPQQPYAQPAQQPYAQPPQQPYGYPQAPPQQPYGNGYPQQPQAPQRPAATTFSDPNSFLMGGGIPAAQFPQVGATVAGTVEDMEVVQQRDLDTNQPLWWDDGRPREQLVVTLATQQRDPANPLDDGRRKLYVKGGSMPQAIAKACRAVDHPEGMAIGGQLTVQYVGDGEAQKRGFNPPKLYAAAYTPPDRNAGANAVLMGGGLEQAPQPPAGVVPFPAPGQVGQAPAGYPQQPQGTPYPVPTAVQQQPQPDPAAAAFAAAQQAAAPLLGQQPQQPVEQPQQFTPAPPQPAAAAPVIPANLPPQVQAALAALPAEAVASALAQMGLAPQPAA